YFQTNTCAGHATISTGSLPESHGLIGNNWYDRSEGRLRACADDASAPLLSYGAPVDGAHGPGNLLVPTLADELKMQLPGTRTVSLAIKPRVGVSLAGQRSDAALWREDFTWVTSTAYTDRRIRFIEQFLDANPVEQALGTIWTRALPEETYLFDGVTEASNPREGWTDSFPYPLVGRNNTPDEVFAEQWENSPWSNDYLGRLAAAAVDALELGQRESTDYLAIGFPALDWTGHDYGPRSHEVQDILIRLDRTVGTLLDHFDAAVGPDQYVVALSADHGVMPIPEQRRARLGDAGRIPASRIVEAANAGVLAALGTPDTVAVFEEQDLYFTPGVYDRLLASPAALAQVVETIRSVEGVADVYRGDTIRERRDVGDPVERALARSYYPGRSGDLLVVLRPYWTTSTNAAGHGTSYDYDTRVPILFLGAGIAPGRYLAEVTPADIAPTLAEIAGITLARTDGRVLTEALVDP
ncbi:MAG: alkaline phosphatase family protein, partial [Vicinamibacterales bacterium]|nr:alkaline phosphatase family protein [Vicinamibacterales bacterium]